MLTGESQLNNFQWWCQGCWQAAWGMGSRFLILSATGCAATWLFPWKQGSTVWMGVVLPLPLYARWSRPQKQTIIKWLWAIPSSLQQGKGGTETSWGVWGEKPKPAFLIFLSRQLSPFIFVAQLCTAEPMATHGNYVDYFCEFCKIGVVILFN